jgi:hypothetical protein
MNSKVSSINRFLALLLGIALPLTEAIRLRINAWGNWPFWANDYILGAFLLYAFWKTRRDYARGQSVLAAAWGLACGMLYMSFFSHLVRSRGPFSNTSLSNDLLTGLTGLGFAISIAGIVLSMRRAAPAPAPVPVPAPTNA